jgi:hypothetical protein
MKLVHLGIYPIRDLAGPSPYKGVYPAALPILKWGHGELNGGFKILQKGSWKSLMAKITVNEIR